MTTSDIDPSIDAVASRWARFRLPPWAEPNKSKVRRIHELMVFAFLTGYTYAKMVNPVVNEIGILTGDKPAEDK